ncbi:hypothetical protein E2562_010261 [Oryza meyeriana var. granulata]|uniref:Uncharacterized protein n=1 Tax=Oryza meyeriana var. granulata TaxID=110450 RepID=A0A6G1EIU4_9ORYZ|nr:hypothetical protein E2562_010261 [Oryza meyeriana var. granulata]
MVIAAAGDTGGTGGGEPSEEEEQAGVDVFNVAHVVVDVDSFAAVAAWTADRHRLPAEEEVSAKGYCRSSSSIPAWNSTAAVPDWKCTPVASREPGFRSPRCRMHLLFAPLDVHSAPEATGWMHAAAAVDGWNHRAAVLPARERPSTIGTTASLLGFAKPPSSQPGSIALRPSTTGTTPPPPSTLGSAALLPRFAPVPQLRVRIRIDHRFATRKGCDSGILCISSTRCYCCCSSSIPDWNNIATAAVQARKRVVVAWESCVVTWERRSAVCERRAAA